MVERNLRGTLLMAIPGRTTLVVGDRVFTASSAEDGTALLGALESLAQGAMIREVAALTLGERRFELTAEGRAQQLPSLDELASPGACFVAR